MLLKIVMESTVDAARSLSYVVKNNIYNAGKAISFAVPYAMYGLGQWAYNISNGYTIGIEAIIPIVVGALSYYMRAYGNKIGKGNIVPVPNKRFTEVHEDGEVTIRSDRLQELVLYMADLEDWIEKKGYM